MSAVQLYPPKKATPAEHCFADPCIRHEACCHCTCQGCAADRGPDRCRECEDEAVTGEAVDVTTDQVRMRHLAVEAIDASRTARRRREFARAIELDRYALALMARARKAGRAA